MRCRIVAFSSAGLLPFCYGSAAEMIISRPGLAFPTFSKKTRSKRTGRVHPRKGCTKLRTARPSSVHNSGPRATGLSSATSRAARTFARTLPPGSRALAREPGSDPVQRRNYYTQVKGTRQLVCCWSRGHNEGKRPVATCNNLADHFIILQRKIKTESNRSRQYDCEGCTKASARQV